jgi:hypothetical protein
MAPGVAKLRRGGRGSIRGPRLKHVSAAGVAHSCRVFNSLDEINQHVKLAKGRLIAPYAPLLLEGEPENTLDCKFISHNLFTA